MFQKQITSGYLTVIFSMLVMTGCGSSNSPSGQPPADAARFAFVVNSQSNNVSTFVVDRATGRLNPKGTVSTGGVRPRRITTEASGHFAYVSNLDSSDISIFAIDANTGDFRMLGTPIATGAGPTS